MKRKSGVDMDAELAALESLDYAALKEKWQALYGVPAPRKISRDFLRHAIAHGLQERALGGLKPAVRRRLIRLADARVSARGGPDAKAPVPATTAPTLRPGARLIREWNGVTHMVEVVDGGFLWRGRPYMSLSAIAESITGAHWSGPRFFGLNGRTTEVFRS